MVRAFDATARETADVVAVAADFRLARQDRRMIACEPAQEVGRSPVKPADDVGGRLSMAKAPSVRSSFSAPSSHRACLCMGCRRLHVRIGGEVLRQARSYRARITG